MTTCLPLLNPLPELQNFRAHVYNCFCNECARTHTHTHTHTRTHSHIVVSRDLLKIYQGGERRPRGLDTINASLTTQETSNKSSDSNCCKIKI